MPAQIPSGGNRPSRVFKRPFWLWERCSNGLPPGDLDEDEVPGGRSGKSGLRRHLAEKACEYINL
jgi:hypothetical protein